MPSNHRSNRCPSKERLYDELGLESLQLCADSESYSVSTNFTKMNLISFQISAFKVFLLHH